MWYDKLIIMQKKAGMVCPSMIEIEEMMFYESCKNARWAL